MAGTSRTVTLNVISNTTSATKGLQEVGDHSEKASKRMSAAFSGVLGTLNSTGVLGPFGEAIEHISGAFDKMGEHGKNAGAKLMGMGAAGVGIGGIFTAIGDKDKAASQQLQASVEGIGESWDTAKDGLESNIKFAEKYGDSAVQTQDALSILTTGLHSSTKATQSFGVVLDLAAKRHEGLSQAATDWVKINEGKGTKILTTLGLLHTDNAAGVKDMTKATKVMTAADDASAKAKQKLADVELELKGKTSLTTAEQIKLRDAHKAVDDAAKKVADAHANLARAQSMSTSAANTTTDAQRVSMVVQGQADAQANTFSGHMKALTTTVEDQAAKLGAKYGPALTGVSAGVTVLGGVVQGASGIIGKFTKANELAKDGQEALTVANDAEGASMLATMGPILLIVAAVVAVGVAIYELWTHWSTIWGWIKGAAEAVWNWIKDHWPLLLDILLGPIGMAVGAIIQHWSTIKNGFTSVKNWIGEKVNDIVDFFVKMPGRIANAVAHAFDSLVNAFKNAAKDMLNAIPGGGIVSSVLGHLPGFADGGYVGAGQLSIVGENGPELFMPGSAGTVIPNHAIGGGGGSVTVGQIVINGGSGDPQAIAAAVRSELLRLKRSNVNGGLS